MCVRVKALSMVVLGFALLAPWTALAQTQGCEEYYALIDKNLPTVVGDDAALTSLLTVDGKAWTEDVNLKSIMKFLGEGEFSQKNMEKYRVGVLKSKSSKMQYNLERGEFRYVNQDRGFDPKNPGRAVDPEQGLTLARKLLTGRIGLPKSEIFQKNTLSRVLQGGVAQPESVPQEGAARPNSMQLVKQYDIESHFFFQRAINGIPVMNSGAFVALSNKGEIAQFRLRWPVMKVDPSLLKAGVLSKTEVTSNIYNRLVEEQPCDGERASGIKKLGMFVAYVPFVLTKPDRDKIPEVARPIQYTPKLIVHFRPEDGEESGVVLEFDLYRK
ncbi:MAG: hypothetical protein KBH99_08520 [Syntrophobacteraceae bacterium]|nr:hypothetical protein [Syntrophobacteraceae bacterium]